MISLTPTIVRPDWRAEVDVINSIGSLMYVFNVDDYGETSFRRSSDISFKVSIKMRAGRWISSYSSFSVLCITFS